MIRAHVTDSPACGQLDPEVVTGYLSAHGWTLEHRTHHSDGTFSQWTKPISKAAAERCLIANSDNTFLVRLAETTTGQTYATWMKDLVWDLAKVEGRSELDVFCDLGGDLGRRTRPSGTRPDRQRREGGG